MTKLTGAALDRAVANALGVKNVHNCERWGEHMNRIEEDDDTQVYKKPWVDLSDSQLEAIYYEVVAEHRGAPMPWGQVVFAKAVQAALKEKNA